MDYYTLLYTIVDKQVRMYMCTLVCRFSYMQIVCLQISAEIQDYLTNHITRGSIPSYQLYLHLRDVLKLARNIPTK